MAKAAKVDETKLYDESNPFFKRIKETVETAAQADDATSASLRQAIIDSNLVYKELVNHNVATHKKLKPKLVEAIGRSERAMDAVFKYATELADHPKGLDAFKKPKTAEIIASGVVASANHIAVTEKTMFGRRVTKNTREYGREAMWQAKDAVKNLHAEVYFCKRATEKEQKEERDIEEPSTEWGRRTREAQDRSRNNENGRG